MENDWKQQDGMQHAADTGLENGGGCLMECSMDLTLVLNTAEKHVQFLLLRGKDMLCGQKWLAGRSGAELLAPALRAATQALGCTPAAIRRIACVAGPGNFTGLRVGLTTASGLARALDARLAGIGYLQCLAASVPAQDGETVLTLTKARSGLAFCGMFRACADTLPQPLDEPRLIDLAGLAKAAQDQVAACVTADASLAKPDDIALRRGTVGSAKTEATLRHSIAPSAQSACGFASANVESSAFPEANTSRETSTLQADPQFPFGLPAFAVGSAVDAARALLPPSCRALPLDSPDFGALSRCALAIDWEHAAERDIAPLYLRDCDAVENLPHIAALQGISLEHAREEMDRLTHKGV